jgi:hypothetical protein
VTPVNNNKLLTAGYQNVRYREVHALIIFEKAGNAELAGAIDELAQVLDDQYTVIVRQVQVEYTKLPKYCSRRAVDLELLKKEIHYFFQLYAAPDILLLVYCGSSTDSSGKMVWEQLRGIS